MNLADAILVLHPTARPGIDFVVAQSGDPIKGTLGSDAIVRWNTATLGPQPTTAQIAAVTPSAASLTAYAASARYAKEIAGITVGTAPVATDRDSQQAITGMWAAAQINPNISIQFKTDGQGFVTIGATQIGKIASAVIAHVQACFAAEAQVAAGVNATPPTVTTTAQIDAAFAAVTA